MSSEEFDSSNVLDVSTVVSFLYHRGIDTDSQNLHATSVYLGKKGEVVVQVLGNYDDKETLKVFCSVVLVLNEGGFVTRLPRSVFFPWKSMTTVHITSYRMNSTMGDVEAYLKDSASK